MRNFAIVCVLAATNALLAHGQIVVERCVKLTATVSDMSESVRYMHDPLLEEE